MNSSLIYGNTLSNIQASNISGLVTISGNTLSNINASNLAFGVVNSSLIYGNTLSNIQSSNITQPFANLVVSNSVTTANIVATKANIVDQNVSSNLTVSGALTSNATNTTFFYDTLTIPYVNTLTMNSAAVTTGTLTASGATSFANIIVANLQVTNTFIITATNTQTTNSLSVINQGTTTALYVNQNEFPNMTYNVAEFWDHTSLAMVIDGYGNVAVHTASSPGYAFTVKDGAKIDNLTVTGSLFASGNTLSNISGSNVTTGINASNVTTGILSSSRIYGNTLSNIQSSNITQPFANLAVSNSVTTTNVFATEIHSQNIYTTGGIDIATDSAFHGNLDVTGNLRPGAIVDSVSSIGSAGQFLTSTGSSIEWSSAGAFTQPLANLVVSNTVTTSEIICNAFTTSTGTNWNYVSNAAAARSTSVGWQGIRQVFGDYITGTIYVYNNAVLEISFTEIGLPQFGAFVAVGGLSDNIIVVSGIDAFYVYYFDGLIWNGPISVDTTLDLGVNNTLWMPSISAEGSLTVTLVIGGYGYNSTGGGNPAVGVYTIGNLDGSTGFIGSITPFNDVADKNRNTVAISGDGTTVAIGQQDSSYLYVYSLSDLITPVFSSGRTLSASRYYVSIDYYGQIVLLTLQDSGQVLMYSISLAPV